MSAMAFRITSLLIVYSAVYSGADQGKHQSSTSLAFVRGIHRWPVNSLHKRPVTRKMFPFDDVIMCHMVLLGRRHLSEWPMRYWQTWHCFNSLTPSDAYMFQQSMSLLLRWYFVACLAPSHHQHQCRLIVNRTIGHKLQWNVKEIQQFSLKAMHLKTSSAKCWPFCLGLYMLTHCGLVTPYGVMHPGEHWFW